MLRQLQQVSRFARARTASEAAYGRVWVITSAIAFGAMAVVTRSVSAEMGAAEIAFIRFALDTVAVVAVALWQPRLWHATKALGLTARGLLGGAAVLGYFMAIEHLSAGLGTMLNYTFPLWSALFGAMFLGEMVSGWKAIGMLVATGGLVVVIGPGKVVGALHGSGQSSTLLGLTAGIVSSVFGGAATTTIRWVRRTDSALAVFGAFCIGGMLVSLPVALRDWRPVSTHAAWMLALIAALSFAAQMLYTYALKFVTAGAGSLAMQLTVVVSYGLAAVALGEPIGTNVGVGALLVAAGVALVSWERGGATALKEETAAASD